MYSIVLTAALAAPAESPSWGWRSGCCGGAGCVGARWSCHGCGGCNGYGSNFSGYGPIVYYGFAGCYGSCYGSYTNYFSYYSMMPNVHYGYGMPMKVAAVDGSKRPLDVPRPPERKEKGEANPSAPAKVIVSLPAGATLFANGYRTTQTSAERVFITPDLEVDVTYHYVFTAETIRDGKSVSESRRADVMAGKTTRVEFGEMTAAQPKPDPTRVVIRGQIGR